MKDCGCDELLAGERYVEQLYERYHRLMFFVAGKYSSDPGQYEDIVQDCLVKLAEKTETLRTLSEPALASYIMAAAKNTALNYVRRQNYDQKLIVHYEDVVANLTAWQSLDASLDDVVIELEDRERVRAIWSQLDEETRRILEGKYYLEYENWELARILGVKTDSVRMKLTRARRKVLELLTEGEEHDKT